jgi:hypothetical protein
MYILESTKLCNAWQIVDTSSYLNLKYFLNNSEIIIQDDGLAMGTPSSSIISEIFLQNIEQIHLSSIARQHKLVNYFHFVDNILLIYDSQHTNISSILNDFNSIHPKLHFMEETEQNNKINYLDITIHKKPTSMSISVFRKPTYTDTLIPYTSNHPIQQKYAAVSFLYNRLNSYHLQDKEHQQEKKHHLEYTIQQFLPNMNSESP